MSEIVLHVCVSYKKNVFSKPTVTLGFFDDILLPPTALQHPSRFEEAEQAWVWEYHPSEEAEKHDLYMDIGEPIKFRVSGEVFEESSPVGPPSNDKQLQPSTTEAKTPYKIIVSRADGYIFWRLRILISIY